MLYTLLLNCLLSITTGDSLRYNIRPATGTDKPVLLILMHGYGADENDLFSLAPAFPKNYIIVTPQAPYKIGATNYQWYTGKKNPDNTLDGNAQELAASVQKMEGLIKTLQTRYRISPDRTFVGGFSQGANMSYQLGLKDPQLIHGVGVLSGTIFKSLKTAQEQTPASKLAIFIGHGDSDTRIPYTEATNSKNWLDSHHYHSELHTYKGMSHSISEEEVKDFIQFMQKQQGASK